MNKIKLRKAKKYLSENKFRFVIISIILFSFFLITGYAMYSTTLGVNGLATIENDEYGICEDNVTGELIFDSLWIDNETGKNVYSYTLIVENLGSEPILNWVVVLKGPSDLSLNWANANVTIRDDNALVFTPHDWNNQIEPGDKLNLPLAVETVEEELNLRDILFNNCRMGTNSSGNTGGNEDVELVEIVLTPIQHTMEIGDKVLMRAVKNPTNAAADLTWSSSNESVATVSNNGLVTALSAGTTQITVSSGDISTTSTIIVTEKEIIDPNPTNDELSISFSSPYYYIEGREIQFKIIVKNNTDTAYKKFSFNTSFPANSTYDLWQNPGVTISGSRMIFDILWNQTLPANGTVEFTGNIRLPEGYSVLDYLNPTFSDITIIE